MKFFVALAMIGIALPAFADGLAGHWYTEDNESIVEITRDDEGVYTGRIVWLAEPDYTEADDVDAEYLGKFKRDLNNPESDERQTPIIGLEILKEFTARASDRWDGGTIYDPNNGRTYKCTMRLDRNGQLIVRGFVGISAFGRSTTWVRVSDADIQKHLAPEGNESR